MKSMEYIITFSKRVIDKVKPNRKKDNSKQPQQTKNNKKYCNV